VPDHAPVVALSVCPACDDPEIDGTLESAGATACTTAVGAELAELEPAPFDAVTTTSSVEPTSPGPSWYVGPVAPATGAQFAPD
jgi:hypothetical protein